MPWMTINVTNIFSTQDEFTTVKGIINMIGISLFTTKDQDYHKINDHINHKTRH